MHIHFIEQNIKYLIFFLFSFGIMIPHHWDFGINIGLLKVYYEEIIVILLTPLVIFKFFSNLKIRKKMLALLAMFFTVILFSFIGVFNSNSIVIIFKDIRMIIELIIILYAISLIKLKYRDIVFLQYLLVFALSIYFIQYLYSFLFETYLLDIIDKGMSMGLKRIVLSNHIAVLFMLPFIYYINKRVFYYLFILIFIISVLSMKRTDIGLLLILSLLFIKKINFKYIMVSISFFILFILIILNLEFGSRFINVMDGSADTRLYGLITAFNDFLQRPIFGFGFGKEMIVTIQNIGGVDLSKNYIDNSYITMMVKMGLFGSLLYISILLKLIYRESNKPINIFLLLFFLYGFFSAYMIIGSRIILYAIPFAYLCVNNFNFGRKNENTILRKT